MNGLGEKLQLLFLLGDAPCKPARFLFEERNVNDGGSLENGADAAARISLFNSIKHVARDTYAAGEILGPPMAFDTADADHLPHKDEDFAGITRIRLR